MAKLFLAFARTGLITGAVILLFVLSAPLLRKKYTARLRRAVWLLLAVLLLLPFSLFPTVLLPGREAPLQIELPVAAAEAVLARQQPDSSAANSGWQRDAAGQAAALPANDPVPAARPAAQPAAVAQPTDLSPLLPQKPTPPTPAPLSPLGIASFVWLGGALMLLLGQLLHYALWRRRLRRWDQPLSPQLAQAVDRAAQVVRLRRPPPALLAESSPRSSLPSSPPSSPRSSLAAAPPPRPGHRPGAPAAPTRPGHRLPLGIFFSY